MPRDGNDLYSKAAGTTAVANETITSTQFNSTVDDIVEDLNAARPLSAGGTGATSATTARTALDVAQKQSSTTDTTAGRGLIVGGFGIGGAGVATTDLNAALYSGVYNAAAGTLNGPLGVLGIASSCVVTRYNSGNVLQILLQRSATPNNPQMYLRQMTGSVWGAWMEVYTAYNLLGTVSQSSGVPTGSVIERGSNGNGEYVRFADGTQICTKTITGLGPIDSATGGLFRSAEIEGGSWAKTFTAINGVSMYSYQSDLSTSWIVGTGGLTTSVIGGFFLYRAATSAITTYQVKVTGTGTWFA